MWVWLGLGQVEQQIFSFLMTPAICEMVLNHESQIAIHESPITIHMAHYTRRMIAPTPASFSSMRS
jgi:hypothetical protein